MDAPVAAVAVVAASAAAAAASAAAALAARSRSFLSFFLRRAFSRLASSTLDVVDVAVAVASTGVVVELSCVEI